MSLILKAAWTAREAHSRQVRKWGRGPFHFHVARVAGLVAAHPGMGAGEEAVAAAYLHDTVEDGVLTSDQVLAEFGPGVWHTVMELTNASKLIPEADRERMSRAERKEMDRVKLGTVSWEAKIIKMYDRLDNLRDLETAPRDFVQKYLDESRALLDVIGHADPALLHHVLEVCDDLAYRRLPTLG